ncbi:MAG: SDR family NAD(P)-dependent oxidoreductase [Actinomycetota bacterium]
MRLAGAIVVVTGASAGIGEATATRFARAGSTVVLAARRLDRLEALAAGIDARGGRALAVRCDVTRRADVEDLVARTYETFGRCDVLVNDAGVPGGGPFAELTLDQIEHVVDVNLGGVLLGTHAFLPGMLERGHSHVVNVASIAGRFAMPGAAVYSATKHAVVAFSEALDGETRDRGVRVTAVNPGLVVTEGFRHERLDPRLLISLDRVAGAIVHVVRRDVAPEYTIPRWLAPLQAFRVLTPPLYRWGVRAIGRGGRATRAGDDERPAGP